MSRLAHRLLKRGRIANTRELHVLVLCEAAKRSSSSVGFEDVMTAPKFLRAILATALWGFGAAAPAAAATVTLAWDRSSSSEVTGYEVCASLTTTCSGGVVSIGNRTDWTFQGLGDNRQYYFFVRAVSATSASGWAHLPYATPVRPPAGSEPTRSDFNGDGLADIIWQNNANNQLVAWHMSGPAVLTWRFLSNLASPGWKIKGSGDLNQDGKPDLIWMHQAGGDLAYWLMDGTLMYGWGGFSFRRVDVSWNLVSVRDMDRDGHPDFVWHNLVNGQLVVWYMDGPAVRQSVAMSPAQVSDTNWKARATADFTGDGWADLLWHNQATGQLIVWEMRGHTFVASHAMSPGTVGPTWKIGAVEDVNGDGWPDIVWQNDTKGELVLWVMVGKTMWAVSPLSIPATDSNWKMGGPR